MDERFDFPDLADDESPVTRAMLLLQRAHLMPPVSSVGAVEDEPVIVSSAHGFTPEQVIRIEEVLADIPHRVVLHPVAGAIYHGGSGT